MAGSGKRVVFLGPGYASVEEFALPQPGPRQVLVRSECSLISGGTELHLLLGQLSTHRGFPVYPGYAAVGTVAEVGEGVQELQVGQRVLTMGQHSSHILLDLAVDKPGGPDYWEVIAPGVSSEEATFAILGSVAMHAVRRSALQLGESVAVFGVGVVGQLLVQLARLAGACPVIAVDLREDRLQLARESGAQHLVQAGKDDVVGHLLEITNGIGVRVLFEATHLGEGTIPLMMRAAAFGARLVVVGSLPKKVEIDPYTELQRRELAILGCFQPLAPIVPHHYFPWTQQLNRRLFLEWLQQGQLKVGHLITHRVPFTAAPQAYKMLERGRPGWTGVILQWS
jgi:2-desacetyl-2-hydroxyethyl bacteriochlorophyllide A dehydrogenase